MTIDLADRRTLFLKSVLIYRNSREHVRFIHGDIGGLHAVNLFVVPMGTHNRGPKDDSKCK